MATLNSRRVVGVVVVLSCMECSRNARYPKAGLAGGGWIIIGVPRSIVNGCEH
jgi:hypothetical protein